jgi:hypothetical protein
MSGGGQFDWDALIPHEIHPLKIAIIEALVWIELPLSAVDLGQMFNEPVNPATISYHLGKLAKAGALEVTRNQRGRGAPEKSYFLPMGK